MEGMEQPQQMDNVVGEDTENVEGKDMSGDNETRRPTVEGQLHRFYKFKRIHFDKQRIHIDYLFDQFWSGIYTSAACLGDEIKILDPSLSDVLTLEIAKMFRMGWEEQHFFPMRLALPFLEICLFNREEEDFDFIEVTKEMFLMFITPEEKEVVKRATEINQEVLVILSNYCPSFDFSKHVNFITLEDACITAAKTIMCTNTKKTVDIWKPVLVGLMEMEEFRFFMKKPIEEVSENEDNYEELSKEDKNFLPHKIWKTFFYNWPPSKIEFYFAMLNKGNCICFRCGLQNVSPQHILGNQDCEKTQRTMCKERHDCVLRKVEEEMLRCIESCSGQFFRGRDWRYLIKYGGKKFDWPKELKLGEMELFPDIVLYSMELGEVLIIDLEITLEKLVHPKRIAKRKQFSPLVNKLIKKKFIVYESYLVCGCRGVLLRDFFNLFISFGMAYKNNSRALEKICQQLFTVPYNDYEYLKARCGGVQVQNTVDISMDTQ